MQQEAEAVDALGVRVVTVTFEGMAAARAYAQETASRWPLLVDDGRRLYDAYGLGRAKLRHLLGFATIKTYVREALDGRWPRWPVADTVQQGGDVIIDPGGIVRFVHVGAGPGDRPSVSRLLAVCRDG